MTFKQRMQSISRCEPLMVGILLLLALALRLWNLPATSLWIDEIYSLIVGNTHLFPDQLDTVVHPAGYFYEQYLSWQPMDWERLVKLLKINVHMPLYYLLLNPWLGWFGNDETGLRSFSSLCSALMILPVFLLGKSMAGRMAGYFCALVVALLPFQIYYGQEGRMYALSLFWAAWAGLAFWQLLFGKRPGLWGWVYALVISGGMLSHYMFIFFLGFQALFAIIFALQSQNWKRLLNAWPALLALGVIACWWAPVYQLQQQGVNDDYHFAKGLVDWTRYLSVPLWQPLVVVAGDNRLNRLFYIPLTIGLLLWGALTSWLYAKKRISPGFPLKTGGYLLAWVWVPLLLQIAYDLLKHTHISIIDRYAMLISPAMGIVLGLLLHRLWAFNSQPAPEPETPNHAKGPKKINGTVCAGLILTGMFLVALASVWAPSPFRDEHNKDDNIREKIGYFTAQARPDDLIFVNGPFGAPNLAAYYLYGSRPQQPILYWISHYQGQPVALPPKNRFNPYQRVWLFRHRANNERGLQTAKDYLQSMYPYMRQTHDWFIYSKNSTSL